MRVTLIRHAEAGDDAPSDGLRALTARGRADARRVGRALARRGVRFSLIVTSPLVRAVQTAEIVAAATDYRARVVVSERLIPDAAPADVAALIAAVAGNPADARSLALVAHEPILSAVAAALLRRPQHPALRKAEALRVRLPDGWPAAGPGEARWRVDPSGHRERL